MNPRSFYISIGLHLGIVVLAIVGLPSLKRPLPENQPLVTLEMVQTLPKTNVNEGGEVNTAKEEQQAARRKQPAPPPPPLKPAPPASDTSFKPTTQAPDPTAQIIPEKPHKKRKLAEVQPPAPPKSKPQQAAKKMPTKLPKAPPKRANKLAQQNEFFKKRTDALTGVMQNLAKAKAVNEDAEKKRITLEENDHQQLFKLWRSVNQTQKENLIYPQLKYQVNITMLKDKKILA